MKMARRAVLATKFRERIRAENFLWKTFGKNGVWVKMEVGEFVDAACTRPGEHHLGLSRLAAK